MSENTNEKRKRIFPELTDQEFNTLCAADHERWRQGLPLHNRDQLTEFFGKDPGEMFALMDRLAAKGVDLDEVFGLVSGEVEESDSDTYLVTTVCLNACLNSRSVVQELDAMRAEGRCEESDRAKRLFAEAGVELSAPVH